jgi:hypothetical protein
MPLTFHEKMRMLLASSGGSGSGADVDEWGTAVVAEASFLRFAGGGLMLRLMLEWKWRIVRVVLVKCRQ